MRKPGFRIVWLAALLLITGIPLAAQSRLGIALPSAQAPRVWLEGQPEVTYGIEASTNLRDWTNWLSLAPGSARVDLPPPRGDSPRQMFRAFEVPQATLANPPLGALLGSNSPAIILNLAGLPAPPLPVALWINGVRAQTAWQFGSHSATGTLAQPLPDGQVNVRVEVQDQDQHPLAAASTTCAVAARTNVFYVAPGGSNGWSGRFQQPAADGADGPLADLAGARDARRSWRLKGGAELPASIVVADGAYALASPLVLSYLDSGAPATPVVYQAAPGARPVFSGGRRITGWQPGAQGIWTTRLPEVNGQTWYFEQLWVNGRRATRARSPNQFYHYMQQPVPTLGNRAFQAAPAALQALAQLNGANLHDVTVVAYHSWETSRHRISSVDTNTGLVILTGDAPWAFLSWGSNQRFHLENFAAALDAPGEWFLSRDGQLSYLPLPGENLGEAEVYAPAAAPFLRLVGEPANNRHVEWVTFQGLSFTHGQYVLPAAGHGDGQAETTIPAAISVTGGRHITLRDLAVSRVGTWAMEFHDGSSDCLVSHCCLEDLGAGGIRIGDTTAPAAASGHTTRIRIDNNIIRAGGRIHAGAIGVWIGHSGGNWVTHNEIADFFYTGVSVGWVWGYAPSLAVSNHIDLNHIHHLGWGVLSDLGGVYTLGVSPGATVNQNRLHDIFSYDQYGRGGWGLYNDEGSSYITVASNLVYRVKTGGYHQHYGASNRVANNILAFSQDGQIQRSRAESHQSFTFENNLVYWSGGRLLAGAWSDYHFLMRSNLYWNTTGESIDFNGLSLAAWQQAGQDRGSRLADPLFLAPAQDDFRLASASPARLAGFVPFDTAAAGAYGEAAWIAQASSIQYGPVESPPAPPPMQFFQDFEWLPLGAAPPLAVVSVESKGDSIAVTNAAAAGGRNCLRITDAPGLQQVFNPHFYYQPYHRQGATTCGFDIRVEAATDMYHEWRDWRTAAYQTGPSFWIKQGRVSVAGTALLNIPLGQWVHLEVVSKVGSGTDGTWTLRVALPGQAAREFRGLRHPSAAFRELTWLGFVSMAATRTSCDLDNLRLANQ